MLRNFSMKTLGFLKGSPASAVPESKRKLAPILCNHVAAVQARPYCNDLFVPQSYYNGYPGLNASAAMGIV